MVLDKDSSVMGYHGEVSRPLDADNHGVCKYENREDLRYITVRNSISALMSSARTKRMFLQLPYTHPKWLDMLTTDVQDTGKNQATDQIGSHPLVQASFEEFLSVAGNLEEDYNFFRDRWTFDTCAWILDNETFKTWSDDPGRELPSPLDPRQRRQRKIGSIFVHHPSPCAAPRFL